MPRSSSCHSFAFGIRAKQCPNTELTFPTRAVPSVDRGGPLALRMYSGDHKPHLRILIIPARTETKCQRSAASQPIPCTTQHICHGIDRSLTMWCPCQVHAHPADTNKPEERECDRQSCCSEASTHRPIGACICDIGLGCRRTPTRRTLHPHQRDAVRCGSGPPPGAQTNQLLHANLSLSVCLSRLPALVWELLRVGLDGAAVPEVALEGDAVGAADGGAAQPGQGP